MKFLKLNSIQSKLAITAVVTMALGVAIYLVIMVPRIQERFISNSVSNLENETKLLSEIVNQEIFNITSDVISLAKTPPVQGIIRARDNNGFDEEGNSSYTQWTERLGNIFEGVSESKGFYYQLRYINEDGDEMVRVDNIDGNINVVSQDDLQNKKDRYYFTSSISLPDGNLYVSHIDLNKEGNPPSIEIPYKPVVRYAYTIYDQFKEPRGIIIANVNANLLLDILDDRRYGQDVIFADNDGYYLKHSVSAKEWGSQIDLGTGEKLSKDYPNAAEVILKGDSGSIRTEEGLFVYTTVPLAKGNDESLIIIRQIDISEVSSLGTSLSALAVVTAIIIALSIIISLTLITRRIIKPLQLLTESTKKIGEGNFKLNIPVNSNDEIGVLSKSIKQMSIQLSTLYRGMEQKIAERTNDLNEKVSDLEKNKIAILNLAEDLESEKKKLTVFNNKLKELDKVKDQFLSVASHELRTPLSAIDGLVSMIRDGEYGKISKNLDAPLKDINSSSERLIHLVNDLLSLSRIQAGRLKYNLSKFNAKEVIDKTLNNLKPLAKEKKIKLVNKSSKKLVFADAGKFEQILTNLIGNSLKFTDKGSITVETSAKGDLLVIKVIDTGIGIKEEDKEKLFGKFEQLDTQKGRPAGTGLGLHLSKEMAIKMGGDVLLASSEVNKGSIFELRIPLAGTKIAKEVAEIIEKDAKLHPNQKSN